MKNLWQKPAQGRAAFTLIELLLVIVIIGILIAMIGAGAHALFKDQKRKSTENVLRNIGLAIDDFSQKNPLANAYDSRAIRTFGAFPPYQVEAGGGPSSVMRIVEPNPPGTLSNRLWTDLSNGNRTTWTGTGNVTDYVRIFPPASGTSDRDDDNRALYTYLAVYARDSLKNMPEWALKPLRPGTDEYVNPMGNGTTPGSSGLVDVRGFHDAWGVPLDYMLYVRIVQTASGPMVAERKAVLRSHGIEREKYDAIVGNNAFDAKDAIFSEPLPSPVAVINPSTGVFTGAVDGSNNGWVRARPAGHPYIGYRPQDDPTPP